MYVSQEKMGLVFGLNFFHSYICSIENKSKIPLNSIKAKNKKKLLPNHTKFCVMRYIEIKVIKFLYDKKYLATKYFFT